jgi:hypothetical protein
MKKLLCVMMLIIMLFGCSTNTQLQEDKKGDFELTPILFDLTKELYFYDENDNRSIIAMDDYYYEFDDYFGASLDTYNYTNKNIYHTYRGLKIGDSISEVFEKYGDITWKFSLSGNEAVRERIERETPYDENINLLEYIELIDMANNVSGWLIFEVIKYNNNYYSVADQEILQLNTTYSEREDIQLMTIMFDHEKKIIDFFVFNEEYKK